MSMDAEKPTRTFLTKLYAKLKELAGDKVSKEDFDSAVSHARGHAGGMAKAAKKKDKDEMMMGESLNAFINRISTALYEQFTPNYSDRAIFGWAKEVFDDYVIACSNEDGKDYRIPFTLVNDEIQFGEPIEVTTEYVPVSEAHEVADLCADGHGMRLFNAYDFADPPDWIPYLPKPGKYNSPRYGEISITKERNQGFVDNFSAGVYQEKLPIDAEHETELSGACGWITLMRVNDDGSVDAKVDWTNRGTTLIENDRFKYFSPSWFEQWKDPATEEIFKDVAIGGALTTRPFFKEKALRPLVASERGLEISDAANVKDGDVVVLNFTALTPVQPKGAEHMAEPEKIEVVDPQKFAEVQTKLTEAETKVSATEAKLVETETALKAAEEKANKADERISTLEKEARASRFKELSKEWVGEGHVAMLEHLSEGGEDGELFKTYVTQQSAAAEQIKKAGIFSEIGSSAPAENSAEAKVNAKVKEFREADPNLSEAQAFDKVWTENPELRQQYREEQRRATN